MKIHYIQHVPFEGLGAMESYLLDKGHELSVTRLYAGERLPDVDNLDWLIVMGGPMGIYDYDEYAWLKPEKAFIQQAIDAGKTVLGVCLGAQLIADVMGSSAEKRAVYAGKHKEIGWFGIEKSPELDETILGDVFPPRLEVFHWHGDMFDVPEGAQALGSSAACPNQGFVFEDRVVGFQFHLETTLESATALIENCGDEVDGSQFVQDAGSMLVGKERFQRLNQTMYAVLDKLGA